MIRRAPRADSERFVIIRNDVVRDPRLSYVATGVLADVLSRPDDWRISAERLLAMRPGKEGRGTVRRALRELEAAGYITRERMQVERGRWTTVLTVHDVPQGASPPRPGEPAPDAESPGGGGEPASPNLTETRASSGEFVGATGSHTETHATPPNGANHVSAGRTDDRLPNVGGPNVGGPTVGNPHVFKKDHRTEEGRDRSVSASLRSADAHTDDHELPDFRSRDRSLWRELLGGALRSDGSGRWGEGVYTADGFYDAFRQVRGINYPGRWLEAIDDRRGGIEDWLVDERLEVVPVGDWRADRGRQCPGCGGRLVLAESHKAGRCARCRVAPPRDPWERTDAVA